MTETDWDRSASAEDLLDVLFPTHGLGSTPPQPRKLRLYLTALCRVAWGELPAVCKTTTEFAERLADDPMGAGTLQSAVRQAAEAMTRGPDAAAGCAADLARLGLTVPPESGRRWTGTQWHALTWMAFLPHWPEVPPYRWVRTSRHRADLVRDVFGNPFRTVAWNPAWRSPTVVGLAGAIYGDRAFDRLPILADALEDAGCGNLDVLSHCRADTPHARGCWVADFILGKS